MTPVELAGDYIEVLWSTSTKGSYLQSGGHLGLTNRGTTDICVWIGAVPTLEFTGSSGTHTNPALTDISDLLHGIRYTHDVEGLSGWSELTQDPYGRYIVKDGLKLTLFTDGVPWTAGQLTYAREFIRKFGIRVPPGAYYEPLVAPTSTFYSISADDSIRQIANLVT
jgi:hypothetical protein